MLVFRPYASVEILDKELERQEKLGVIEKTDKSQWAASTVYAKKKKKKESVLIIRLDLMIV